MLQVLRARAYTPVSLVRPHDDREQIRRLEFVCAEVRRLFHHPGLFPSLQNKTRFVALLASDSNLQFVQAVTVLLLRETMREFNEHSQDHTRSSYLRGSKGWENFLLNGAPGLPLAHLRITTVPKTSFQVVPITGLRIVGDANREEQFLAGWITDAPVPDDLEPAVTTKLLDLDKPEDPEGLFPTVLSQQSYDIFLQPNPFRESSRIRLDISPKGREPLEDFTPFVGRLESVPIPQNHPIATLNAPNIFPVISLRSWHPPTKLGQIRYIRKPQKGSTDQQETVRD